MENHDDINPLAALSEFERQVASYLLAGMNSSEIAKRLSLSYQLVAETGRAIKHKLNVTTLDELRKLASRQV